MAANKNTSDSDNDNDTIIEVDGVKIDASVDQGLIDSLSDALEEVDFLTGVASQALGHATTAINLLQSFASDEYSEEDGVASLAKARGLLALAFVETTQALNGACGVLAVKQINGDVEDGGEDEGDDDEQ